MEIAKAIEYFRKSLEIDKKHIENGVSNGREHRSYTLDMIYRDRIEAKEIAIKALEQMAARVEVSQGDSAPKANDGLDWMR